ncbi:MAG: amidohydrolase family protein [Chloroflexi bacterium]|nr:amidohydrolase family protein [Chloroflexota bacterium]
MELVHGLISVDDHVQEPPDLWTTRLSKARWGDRVPRLERSNGDERWVVDGQVLLEGHVARTGAFMPDRNQEPGRWDDVPPAAYVPSERLRAMDAGGVDYSVLYPTVAGMAGQGFAGLRDPEIETACVRAYNDWVIEEWASVSDRFVPQCIVPIWPPEATVAEIQRAVASGHRGVVFPSVPMDLRDVPHVADADYDPVWAVCEELEVPLCLHAGASTRLQYASPPGLPRMRAEALDAVTKPVSSVFVLNLFIFSRILMRHPKLRLVLAESALSWGMLDLEWSDHQAEHDGLAKEGYDTPPSAIFHRQCYLNGWYDRVAPFAHYVGPQNILWSTNMPLATSTWPRTRETIDRCFQGVSTDVREQVLWRNAATLYKL